MKTNHTYLSKPNDWLLLIVINSLIALMLTIVGEHDFVVNLIFSQCIGFLIAITVTLTAYYLNASIPTLKILVFTVPTGVLIGTALGSFIIKIVLDINVIEGDNFVGLSKYLVFSIVIGIIVSYFFNQRALKERAEKEVVQQALDKQKSEKALVESELKLLQAQIEPHFLFNTLSNVMSLIENEPATAKNMLQSLTQYLRVGLNRTRDADTTVADEVSLLESYLTIQKIRMGERLGYSVKATNNTLSLKLPPLLIQPLVENALKHGIEKQIEGGDIAINFFQENNVLMIEIKDSGYGMKNTSHDDSNNGIGLLNVEKRLKSIYGQTAKMTITDNKPQGLIVKLYAPLGDN